MNFAERIQQQRQAAYEVGLEIGFQQAIDYMCLALNDADTMGKPMGGDKIDKVCNRAVQYQHEFITAFRLRDPEADVYQEHLDAAMRKIFKDKAQPFNERYPAVRSVKY